jgi:hypothetical protein
MDRELPTLRQSSPAIEPRNYVRGTWARPVRGSGLGRRTCVVVDSEIRGHIAVSCHCSYWASRPGPLGIKVVNSCMQPLSLQSPSPRFSRKMFPPKISYPSIGLPWRWRHQIPPLLKCMARRPRWEQSSNSAPWVHEISAPCNVTAGPGNGSTRVPTTCGSQSTHQAWRKMMSFAPVEPIVTVPGVAFASRLPLPTTRLPINTLRQVS